MKLFETIDFREYVVHLLFVILGAVILQMIVAYPFMLIFFFVLSVVYIIIDWKKFYGWKHIGKINHIYGFLDDETVRNYVVYVEDKKNNINKVVQHISATMVRNLTMTCIEYTPIIAVQVNGEQIELYSCGRLISEHLTIMAQWNDWGEEQLWLGILKEDWDALNEAGFPEEKVEIKSYILMDMDDPDKDIYNRQKNPHENYIFSKSKEWQIALKIQDKVYDDVSICMRIFEDRMIPLYENFWMYGIYKNTDRVSKKKIAIGDDVYINFKPREYLSSI